MRTRPWVPGWRRLSLGVAALAGLLVVALLGWFVALPVLAPFTRVQVPADCTTSVSHLPADRDHPIPGDGEGTLVASDGDTAVVVAADYGRTPFTAHVDVIDTARPAIIRRFTFDNDVVDAGFDGSTLYLFNNKLGFFVDTGTGALLQNVIETDNYRGMFDADGDRFVQSSITVSAITSGWRLILRHHFRMSSVADGCYLG